MATTREIRDRAFRDLEGIRSPRVQGVRRNQGEQAAQRVKRANALDLARNRGAKIPRS